MKYEPNNIISRIEWCRLQQRIHSVTVDEAQAGGPRRPASSMPWTVVIGECS